MDSFRIEQDAAGIATITMDLPGQAANTMNARFREDFIALVDQLAADASHLKGVILASAKKSFFAGGDLAELLAAKDGPQLYRLIEDLKLAMRKLETMGVPVIAALGGSALGGGWELALCCHQRICVDDPRIELGLPECALGLIPGGGGIVRMVRLLGLQAAVPYFLESRRFHPQEALAAGLIQGLVPPEADLLARARLMLEQNPLAQQPWDAKGHRIPGGGAENPKTAQMLAVAPANLRSRTRGLYPAPEAALSVAVESTRVDFDTALRIESRAFAELALGQVAKNMIGTLWFGLNEVKGGARRPAGIPSWRAAKVGVLGAGMMGAGIAHACAIRGLDTVLKDVTLQQAERGKAHTLKLLEKRVQKGAMSGEKRDEVLARIRPTCDLEDLRNSDLIIEAVFENRDLKEQVIRECEPALGEDGIFASNTSTLPITGLAKASSHPANFVGLHFFSPVDRMQLVEIIKGAASSPETLARAYDFVLQIGKVPILVNDSRGFFTSRVFGTFTNEGAALLADGVPPAVLENAAVQAGMPVGPLAVMDEVTLTLFLHAKGQEAADCAAEGLPFTEPSALEVLRRMVAQGRPGRSGGGGFYDYPADGPKSLWKGLATEFPVAAQALPFEDIKDRFLYIQSLESLRCLEEGVLESMAEANVGSILGIGFPAWTGGVIQFVNAVGTARFCARAEELATRYGPRFAPPALLKERAIRNEPIL